ncbi:hypothetical protein [Nocardia abscessus]|uniref:hypothetical protein n=1 Tax=Nocardia abscessus TaxID=120957 RepID=UPI0002F4F536|nr:hypothetical protein [Nocardia abscessus]MCC3332282.1 hypothetical protein [Nocardia abscessus]
MNVVAAQSYDWRTLYGDIEQQGNVPCASATVIDATHAVFRAMYLDLGEVQTALHNSGFDPVLVTLVADVVNVPAGISWQLQETVLWIQTRRMQSDEPFTVTLDYRNDHGARFVLFCDELAGSVQGQAVLGSQQTIALPVIDAPPPSGGVLIKYVEGSGPVQSPLDRAHGVAALSAPDYFQQALRTEFLFASLLYDTHPELALRQLTWLKNWSGYNAEFLGVLLRSSSLLTLLTAQMNAESDGTVFVPYLSRQVYTELAKAFVAEAKQYEGDYQALSTQKVVTDNFIQLAKNLLANKTYETQYTTQLLDQAKNNFDNASAAVTAAQQRLTAAQDTAEETQIDFEEIGVPEWKRQQILKAIIDLSTAVITFGVGIGAMFVGDPAVGAAAAGSAIKGAEAVEAAAEAGSEVATLAKRLKDCMDELKKIAEALKKVYDLSKEIVDAVENFHDAEEYAAKLRDMNLDTGGADLTATYQWRIYQQNTDAMLADPVEKGIRYARELELAVDAVAIHGQELAAAQVAAVAAGQQYAAVSLQKQLAEQEQQQLQQYVDSLVRGEAPLAALMQQLYLRYLDTKSSLFTALQGYRASYFYWALAPSVVRPRILDNVGELDTGLTNLTSITMDSATALEHFSPPPQILADKRYTIDSTNAPDVLAQFKKSGTARFVVPLDTDEFAGFGRVRLTRVRVWVENGTPRNGASVNLQISTQGNYLDRYRRNTYQFTSKPLDLDFEYRLSPKKNGPPDWTFDDGTYGYVEVDGALDHEVSYAYFEPTPFAGWNIMIDPSTIDLTNATSITMQFSGSIIHDA